MSISVLGKVVSFRVLRLLSISGPTILCLDRDPTDPLGFSL